MRTELEKLQLQYLLLPFQNHKNNLFEENSSIRLYPVPEPFE